MAGCELITSRGEAGRRSLNPKMAPITSTARARCLLTATSLGSVWKTSSDAIYSNGFLRAKIRNNVVHTDVGLTMRVNPEDFSGYYFAASSFLIPRVLYRKNIGGGAVSVLADVGACSSSFEDWTVEAGVVGDQLSMKVWRDGSPEPTTPQLLATDPTPLPDGQFGHLQLARRRQSQSISPGRHFRRHLLRGRPFPVTSIPTQVVDAPDIDLLSLEVRRGMHPPKFDLNGDKLVNLTDHEIWVHELKNTWIGDADLNLEFNSNDFVQVFQAGKYETTEGRLGRRRLGRRRPLRQQRLCRCVPGWRLRAGIADGCGGCAGAGGVAVVASGCGLHSTEGYSATIPAR